MSNNNKSQGQQFLEDQAKKAGKKVAKVAIKKVGTALFSKAVLPFLSIVLVLLLCLAVVSIFTPDINSLKKEVTHTETKERLFEYIVLGNVIPVNVAWLVSMDMTIHENEELYDIDIDDNAYHFLGIEIRKMQGGWSECQEVENEGGEMVETCIEHPPVLLDSWTYEGKNGVFGLFDVIDKKLERKKINRKSIASALHSVEDNEASVKQYVDYLTSLEPPSQPPIYYEFDNYGMDLEFAKKDANLDKEQSEYLDDIVDAEFMDELFEEYGLSMWNIAGMGSGAYCSPTQEVDADAVQTILDRSGVFVGHFDTFISVAGKYGIDPILMISIALHETGNGTSNAVVNKNNPGGLMNPATGSTELFVYGSLAEGIDAMGQTLHNRIIKDGLTTIDALGSVYAPIGAGNDPNGLNHHWKSGVAGNANKLGGLTMNCEQYFGESIVFDGDVSEIAKIIASVGTQWIGNSKYVFGGGRNPYDVSQGIFDCSSFVHWAYGQAGVDLGNITSTSTETLNKIGKPVSSSELKVGDLIFWDTYKKDGHVGIYIGDGKFIGAQTSNGVSIESLNSPYWSSVFSGHVRRIIE